MRITVKHGTASPRSSASLLWRFFSRASLAWIFVPVFVFLYFFTPRLNLGTVELPIRIPSFFFLGIVAATYLPRKWLFSDTDDGGEHLIGKSFSAICMLSFWIYVTHNHIYGLSDSGWTHIISSFVIATFVHRSFGLFECNCAFNWLRVFD